MPIAVAIQFVAAIEDRQTSVILVAVDPAGVLLIIRDGPILENAVSRPAFNRRTGFIGRHFRLQHLVDADQPIHGFCTIALVVWLPNCDNR